MPDATPAPVAHTPTSGPWQSQHDFDLAGELTIIGNVDGEIINGHTHHTYTLVADVYDNDSAKEDRANARLIVASANSYMKHCADPIAAAEGDLLGEMVVALTALLPSNLGPLPAHMGDSETLPVDMTCGEIRKARALLAKVKRP